jgi:CheY-like chemotaxis protein
MIKILVVEDEKKVSALIKQGLQEVGHLVEVSDTPTQARELIRKNNFDLIYLKFLLRQNLCLVHYMLMIQVLLMHHRGFYFLRLVSS